MKTTLIVVGRTVEQHYITAINDYIERTKHFISFDMEVIPELKNTKKPDTRATEREGRRTDSQSPSAGRRGCVAGRTRKRDAVGGVCPLDGEKVGKRQQTPGIYYRRTLWLFTKGI